MQLSVTGRPFRRIAACECGWSGTKHWFRGSALVEAGIHAHQAGHAPKPEVLLVSDVSPVVVLEAS
jgi:hypothetical protein